MREFRVIRKLAEGGMGVVYLAHDEILDRQIALKVLADRYTGSETARARFYNEARAAGQIDNPAVARVFQYGESAGKHFIAMEYLDGGTLADWLTQHPPPQRGAAAQRRHTRQVASFVDRIASALESAHTQVPPVIHRDVKPSNILLDAEGKPKLTDFGIARMASAVPLTLEGDIPGTPQYMSPEQASAESAIVDHRSDIFSLGVVMYELLTGQRPFDGDTTLQVLHELRTVDPPTVRSICPWIPRDLATICHKALEKRPRDRYQSAIQLAADLRSWRLDEPILARPPSLSRRGLRKVRTHRLALTAFVIVALIGVSAFLGVWARSIANQSLVRVRIDADISGSVVHIRRSDPETGELEAWPTARALPLTRRYPAGMYRVTIVDPEGAFGELDLLIDPAKTRTVSVHAFEREPLEPPATGEERIDYFVRLLDADPPIDMHPVAPGRYRVGEPGFASGPLAERVQEFAPFAIDVHEVSNSEYAAFLRATGHPPPTHWDLILDPNHSDRPAAIRGIDLSD
ncbi:MAG: bifunctional serine/threonine-protein kinase/formylglycine-generating enzyme family protein, partial [Planctomycetota bacterium]